MTSPPDALPCAVMPTRPVQLELPFLTRDRAATIDAARVAIERASNNRPPPAPVGRRRRTRSARRAARRPALRQRRRRTCGPGGSPRVWPGAVKRHRAADPAYADRYVTHTAARTGGPAGLAALVASFARRGHAAYPSQAWLAERLDVSVRTVRRWTAQLERAGVLAVERRRAHHDHITGRWHRRPNRYRCRFAKRRTTPNAGKDQVRPSGHIWPHEAFPKGANGAGAVVVEPVGLPDGPAVPPPPWFDDLRRRLAAGIR